MTTIAYRDGVLAADTLATANGLRDCYGVKIWRVGKRLVGATGSRAVCLKFRDWVAAGMNGASPFEGDDTGNGLVVTKAEVLCFSDKGSWPVGEQIYALGSGYQLAMGAMEMGADPRRAVEVAMKYDTSTGGEITVLKQGA